MIPQDDIKPGMYLAIRASRTSPNDDVWDFIPSPRPWFVLSNQAPYVAAECVISGRRMLLDAALYEFEHLRVETVAALFPEAVERHRRAKALKSDPAGKARAGKKASEEDLDEQGYRKPIRLATIK